MICAKMAEPFEIRIMDSDRLKEAYIRWGPDPRMKGPLLGERTCPRTLLWAVQKWLNRSICFLGCGHG